MSTIAHGRDSVVVVFTKEEVDAILQEAAEKEVELSTTHASWSPIVKGRSEIDGVVVVLAK